MMFDVPFYSFIISRDKRAQEQMWPEKKSLLQNTCRSEIASNER